MSQLAPQRIRGVNYLPMPAISDSLMLAWLPARSGSGVPTTNVDGYFTRGHLRSDLDKIRYAGFNNIRLWSSFASWVCDPNDYMAVLRMIAEECDARNISITYILWNAIPAGLAGTGAFLDSKDALNTTNILTGFWDISTNWPLNGSYPTLVPPGEKDLTHLIEPLKATAWATQGYFDSWADTSLRTHVINYLRAIGSFFASGVGARVFQSYDLGNEMNSLFNGTINPYIKNFLYETYTRLAAVHPEPACTIGWAGNPVGLTTPHLTPSADLVHPIGPIPITYFSLHNYSNSGIGAAVAAALAEARSVGRTLVVSEFFDIGVDRGLLSNYFNAMELYPDVGGQMWCYIQNNAYRGGGVPFDGVITPDQPASSVRTNAPISYRTVSQPDDTAARIWTRVAP